MMRSVSARSWLDLASISWIRVRAMRTMLRSARVWNGVSLSWSKRPAMSFGRSCARTDAPKQFSYASASRFDTMLDSVASSNSSLP